MLPDNDDGNAHTSIYDIFICNKNAAGNCKTQIGNDASSAVRCNSECREKQIVKYQYY